MQTVSPPSTHESGEAIDWEDDPQCPADVDPDALIESVTKLADAVRIKLGEKAAPQVRKKQELPTPPAPAEPPTTTARQQHDNSRDGRPRSAVPDRNVADPDW